MPPRGEDKERDLEGLADLRVIGDDLIIETVREARIISTSSFGSGVRRGRFIVFHRVDKSYNEDPEVTALEVLRSLELPPDQSIVFLTAVDVGSRYTLAYDKNENGNLRVGVVATVGLGNPAGVGFGDYVKNSTINVAVIINRALSPGALVETVKTVTEAKVAAVRDVDLRCRGKPAVGTTTDAIAVATLEVGSPLQYAGQLTEVGGMISKLTYAAVMEGIHKTNFRPGRPILIRLRERGVDIEGVIDAALELFVPWKAVSREKARKLIEDEIKSILEDPNVCSIIAAAMRLEDDASLGMIPGIGPEDYSSDPVRLVADEIIGISLAIYLSGWNGLFEYYRYDSRKPGILKKLPPFLDDVIAALIAGATSRIYSKGGMDH